MDGFWIYVLGWLGFGVGVGSQLYRQGLLEELDMNSHRYNSFNAVLIGIVYDHPSLLFILCGILGPFALLGFRMTK